MVFLYLFCERGGLRGVSGVVNRVLAHITKVPLFLRLGSLQFSEKNNIEDYYFVGAGAH